MKRLYTKRIPEYFAPEARKRARTNYIGTEPESPFFQMLIDDMLYAILDMLPPVYRAMLAVTCKIAYERLGPMIGYLHGNNLMRKALFDKDAFILNYLFEERVYYSMRKGIKYDSFSYTQIYERHLVELFGIALQFETNIEIDFLKYELKTGSFQNRYCNCLSHTFSNSCLEPNEYDSIHVRHICFPYISTLVGRAIRQYYYPVSKEMYTYVAKKTAVFEEPINADGIQRFFAFQKHNVQVGNFDLFCFALDRSHRNMKLRYQSYRAINHFKDLSTTTPDDTDLYTKLRAYFITMYASTQFRLDDYYDLVVFDYDFEFYHWHVPAQPYPFVFEGNIPLYILCYSLYYRNTKILQSIIEKYTCIHNALPELEHAIKPIHETLFQAPLSEEIWSHFKRQVAEYNVKRLL